MATISRNLGVALLCVFIQMMLTEGRLFVATANNVRFYFEPMGRTFADSEEYCLKEGLYLAVLDNEHVNKAVYEGLLGVAPDTTPWFGVKKLAGSCQYRTVDGDRIPNFQNFVATTNYDEDWCATLQAFPFKSDDFQSIFQNGEWYGRLCDELHPVLCMDQKDAVCPGDCKFSDCKAHPWHPDVPKVCRESCEVRDACPGSDEPKPRDLDNYCFFQPYPRVDTFENALAACGENGGTILNILSKKEYDYFVSAGFFEACNVWDQYYLGLYQKPGTGAARWTSNGRVCTLGQFFEPYFGYSHFNLISHDLGLNFWSSKDKSGLVLVLQAKTNAWATLSPHPVAIDSPSIHAKFERRSARHALYWCEARKDDFCMAAAFEVHNAKRYYADCDDKDYDCDDVHIVYNCKEGFEFRDGDTYKRVKCTCDRKAFRQRIPREGCIPIDKCWESNPCDHFCLGFAAGKFRCACKSGFKLGKNGECIDIDECKDPVLNKCPTAPYGGCRNTFGGFLCFCNVGYDMDHIGACQVQRGKSSVDFITLVVYIFTTIPQKSFGSYDQGDAEHEFIRKGLFDSLHGKISPLEQSLELKSISPFQPDIICVVVKVNLAARISFKDQSVIAFNLWKKMGSLRIDIHGVTTRFTDILRVEQDDGNIINIRTLCSIYDGIDYCTAPSGVCQVREHNPHCICTKGFVEHEGRCILEKIADKKKDDDDFDDWSGLDIFLFVAVIVLIVMVICLCICVCSLCGRIGRRSPAVASVVEPTYFPAISKAFRAY